MKRRKGYLILLSLLMVLALVLVACDGDDVADDAIGDEVVDDVDADVDDLVGEEDDADLGVEPQEDEDVTLDEQELLDEEEEVLDEDVMDEDVVDEEDVDEVEEEVTDAELDEEVDEDVVMDMDAAADVSAISCTEPIKVGVITDQTGPLAIYGAHILRGFPIGMEWATGVAGEDTGDYVAYELPNCTIQVYWRDDQSNPEITATMGRELVEVEDVDILVGTVSSGATATLQEIARENEVPLIAAPAAANELTGAGFNEFTFRVSRNNYQDAINICQFVTDEYDTFVQIAPDYSFGYGGATAFRDACTEFGGEFVADDIFAPADTAEFTPYMEQILDSGAEAFLVTWAGGGFVPMMQAAQELGVLEEMDMASAFIDNTLMPTFFANAVDSTSGILYHYTLPDNEANDFLVEQVQEDFSTFPDLFDADGMNAAILVVEALVDTGGDTDPQELLAAMEGMTFQGPKGEIFIRPEDHVAIQDMYIVTLTNVDDPEFRFYEPVTTNRPEPPCLLEGDFVDRCGDLPVGSLGGE
ncbi:MAG: substrate-binding domain-containing protein [Candidatus Promineifilaceae bacterium]|nr:substrate-binding domain-containing protein [Candidatus Promineifilaceae bacterium]